MNDILLWLTKPVHPVVRYNWEVLGDLLVTLYLLGYWVWHSYLKGLFAK